MPIIAFLVAIPPQVVRWLAVRGAGSVTNPRLRPIRNFDADGITRTGSVTNPRLRPIRNFDADGITRTGSVTNPRLRPIRN